MKVILILTVLILNIKAATNKTNSTTKNNTTTTVSPIKAITCPASPLIVDMLADQKLNKSQNCYSNGTCCNYNT